MPCEHSKGQKSLAANKTAHSRCMPQCIMIGLRETHKRDSSMACDRRLRAAGNKRFGPTATRCQVLGPQAKVLEACARRELVPKAKEAAVPCRDDRLTRRSLDAKVPGSLGLELKEWERGVE